MTPATGWTEAAYYRASRAARAAWERTDSQLTIGGLDEADTGAVGLVEPAAPPPVSPLGRRAPTTTNEEGT